MYKESPPDKSIELSEPFSQPPKIMPSQNAIQSHQPTIHAPTQPSVWRSILLAIAITLALNAVIPYIQHTLHTVSIVEGMIPMGVLMPFFVLVFIVNPILRLAAPQHHLRTWELVIIASILYVSSHTDEFLSRAISVFAVSNYMATPENLWQEYALPHIAPHLLVSNPNGQLDYFYEGLPSHTKIPWHIWVGPLFSWLSFFVAIGTGCITLAILMRKQWVDQERIPFPFAKVIESLAEDNESGIFPSYTKNRLFWIGALIPIFVVFWFMIGYFRPDFPVITLGITGHKIGLGRFVPAFNVNFYFPVVGFAYFTDLQVLFSIWFFYVLTWLQIWSTVRFGIAEGLGTYAGTRQQAIGGFVVFCLWALWIARAHIKTIFQHLFAKSNISDQHEPLSYKTAGYTFIACCLYMIFWLTQAGLFWPLSILVVVFWFLFYLGFAKIVAMTGLVFMESPGLGQYILDYAPPGSLADGDLAMRHLVDSTYQNGKCFAISDAAHAARLLEPLGKHARQVGYALIITLALTLIVSATSTISLGHQGGASNFGSSGSFENGPGYFNRMVSSVRNMGHVSHYGLKITYVLWGALVMVILTIGQYRFTWWPFHPIGFTVVTFNSVQRSILSVFVAWTLKAIILKVGGITLYRKSQPFFMGLIVGYTFALIVAIGVDILYFPGNGHNLYRGD
ncbi:MAG: hypothetical protein HOE48_06435 [Candidatus Latescibacteria bacterium]|nr:hypothetical protein [Candidatus Latescibacterota bacterium]